MRVSKSPTTGQILHCTSLHFYAQTRTVAVAVAAATRLIAAILVVVERSEDDASSADIGSSSDESVVGTSASSTALVSLCTVSVTLVTAFRMARSQKDVEQEAAFSSQPPPAQPLPPVVVLSQQQPPASQVGLVAPFWLQFPALQDGLLRPV